MLTDFVCKTHSEDGAYSVVVRVDCENHTASVYELLGGRVLRSRSGDYDEMSTPEAAEAWMVRPIGAEGTPFVQTLATRHADAEPKEDEALSSASVARRIVDQLFGSRGQS